jgi:SanA protein
MMKTVRMLRLLLFSTLLLLGILFLFIVACNIWVVHSARSQIYESVEEIPHNNVALVLGTTSRTPEGFPNPYFVHRIEAAYRLFQQGKVRHFILSGDNGEVYYNEPLQMKKALLKKGVPDSLITLDYAGFRTLDSVVRCYKIFQQQKFTIISQRFHDYRAIFIANHYGLETVALEAANSPVHAPRVRIREWLARCKAVVDLYLLRKGPKFLGDQVEIHI